MLLMIKNHLNGTWFYELLKCYFRVYPIVMFFNVLIKNILPPLHDT